MNHDSFLPWPPTSPNSNTLVSPHDFDHHHTFEHTRTPISPNFSILLSPYDFDDHHTFEHTQTDTTPFYPHHSFTPSLQTSLHQAQQPPPAQHLSPPSHQHPSHDQIYAHHSSHDILSHPFHSSRPTISISTSTSIPTSCPSVSSTCSMSMSTSPNQITTSPTSTLPLPSRPMIEHVIHVPPPPSRLPQLKNIPTTDPAIDQAFSKKVAAKSVKRPRLATKLMVGEKVVPVSRRTKYAKLLETMNAELAAVRQQLQQAQSQLSQYEPVDELKTSTTTSTIAESGSDSTSKKRRLSNTPAPEFTSPSSSTSPPSSPDIPENSHPLPLSSSTSPLVFEQLQPQTRAFLQQSVTAQSLLMGTFVHAPLLFLKMDLRRRILDANVAFCETHGWDRSELIGRLLPPGHPSVKNQPGLKTVLSRLVQSKVPDLSFYEVDDVAPLKNGLPVGMCAYDMLPLPDALQAFSDMHSKRAPYVTFTQRQVNARGQLVEFRGTSWVVYDDGPSYPTACTSLSLPSASSSISNPFPQVVEPPVEPHPLPRNPQSAEAVYSLRDLYSTLHNPDLPSSVLFKHLKQHINPDVLKCLHHPTLDVGAAMQQAFGGPKPLYVMTVVAPSDLITLRHPPESHPHEELDEASRDQQWSDMLENAGVFPFIF